MHPGRNRTRARTPRERRWPHGCGSGATRGAVMKIAIMGSGGIGGYYGALLQHGGADVTFVARGEHLAAMQKSGIGTGGPKPLHARKGKATDGPSTIGKV